MFIRLLQDAYQGWGLYRLHCADGSPSTIVLGQWYEAKAIDELGNEYLVIWSYRPDFDDINSDSEDDACDWDSPREVIDLASGLPVVAEIVR